RELRDPVAVLGLGRHRFGHRHLRGAVHGDRRGEDEALHALVHRRVDQVHAPDHVVRVVEALDEVTQPLGGVGGQVVDVLEALRGEQVVDEGVVHDRSLGQPGAPVDVVREPAAQVVEHDDLVRAVEAAVERGVRVIDVLPAEFSHGGTRNLLMERSSGSHVAFLTADAIPASDRWLAELLAGFDDGPDVALVYGPYTPRPDSSPTVRRELEEFFRDLAPDGQPRVDRGLGPADRRPGKVTYYTDANGCIARWAWERVPYRPVTYAEDQLLALDMLDAGFAKVFRPRAAVIHSHDYPPRELFGRFFDEFRALREVYGHVEEVGPRHSLATIRRRVTGDRAFMR